MTKEEYIEKEIKYNCSPIDTEELFRDIIDESYTFYEVGGLFRSMVPSRVLEECDPTAFRCGHLDYVDSLMRDGCYLEIDETLYGQEAIDMKQDLEEQLRFIEVFYVSVEDFATPIKDSWQHDALCARLAEYEEPTDDDRINEAHELAGYYYWSCAPGCLPDSEAVGPFESEEAAYDQASS